MSSANGVAYFSAEFGIDEALPIYSGGLGVLAGDHIKAANDLELPLVGVGIFYSRGYFQQRIREDGVQEHLYPLLDPEKLPIERVTTEVGDGDGDEDGGPLLVQVPIAGRNIYLAAWCAQVGRVKVYLLTSDVEQNDEQDRSLTDSLYPGDHHKRICQEIILGIGGVRLLRALGIMPKVWHMNEGHSAFMALERIREYSAQGIAFEAALEAVRSNTLFTTHTPVPAGHDVFGLELLDRYLGDFYWQLGASREQVLALGRMEGGFNMTLLAVNASSKVNGVSKLHEEVTKELLHRWTPHIPKQDIPVESVTNGIHIGTWISADMKRLFDERLPEGWLTNTADPAQWGIVRSIPDEELWAAHRGAKTKMFEELGIGGCEAGAEHALVIGFARRFATYKRANLIFRDLDRLDRIVNHPERPVCLLFAGKAHPSDGLGQELIRHIVEITGSERFKDRIHVIENYDMRIAKALVQGVDVWLNTPVKPMEASGTSGQKAAVNGVLNCSILDGWWNEGYNGRNGWGIEGAALADTEDQARADSEGIYRLLEQEIAPLYYRRDERGLPAGWISMMKESIATLAPKFNTHRMVGDYWRRLYVPLMERGEYFTGNDLEVAKRVAAYKHFIRNHWQHVQVREIDLSLSKMTKIGLSHIVITAKIALGPIWHRDVRVEAVGSDGKNGLWKVPMRLTEEFEGSGVYLYEGGFLDSLDSLWLSNGNVRVTPISKDFSSDFEMRLAAWGEQ